MKNGSRTIIIYEENRGRSKWNSVNGGKARIDVKKSDAMYVWWDWKGIVYYELLPPDQTIDSNFYCQQLERLRQVERKRELITRKGVVFCHDNVRPHTFLAIPIKNWENLVGKFWCIHYSPDLAPSNYHLFRSLQNSLNGVKLTSKEACENHLF